MPTEPPEGDAIEHVDNRVDRTVTVMPPSSSADAPFPGTASYRRENETGTFSTAGVHPAANPSPDAGLPPAPPGYELLGEVGRGGMGVVYQARQKGLNRIVALKVVLAGGHASSTQRVRFLQEAEAVAALNHPGIVGVYEFGTWDGQPYVALEFCPGGNLSDKLRGTPLHAREAAALVEQLARSVAVAHARGIIHRDVKPANVLIGTDGTPKIADFGVAKLTETGDGLTATGAIMGTPSYMAPEQARGEAKKVGPPADVYALGAVLYECLTGRPPFKGASSADTILQTLHQEPVHVRALNPLVPVDLETVCLKCLEKEPERRYPTAQAMAADLHRFLDGLPVVARPVGWFGRSQRWVRRNQVVTGLLAAIVLAVLTGILATYVKYRDEATQRTIAVQEAAAKEQALGELRTTLATLESLTDEQTQTLVRLTEQKAASEDAFLRGLLRPMREQQNPQLTLEETRVLFELAAIPEERLRTRFITRALGTADGTAKLAAWPDEVVGAVVGFDRPAARRLRGVIGTALRGDTTAEGRRACVFLAGVLPADDAEFNKLAARTLVDLMVTEKDLLILGNLSTGLTSLAGRLDSADAAVLARLLVARMTSEKDSGVLGHLAFGVSALAPRLVPTEAAAIAQTLLDAVTPETESIALSTFSNALSTLVGRLSVNEASVRLGPMARALVARLAIESDGTALSALSTATSEVSGRLAPVDAATVAKILVGRVIVEKDVNVLNQLNTPLMSMVGRLHAADAKQIVQTLIDRMVASKDSANFLALVYTVPHLLGRLDPPVAAAAIAPLVRTLSERLAVEKDLSTLSNLTTTLSSLSGVLGGTNAAQLTRTLIDRLAVEKDANVPTYLSSALTSLSTLVTATEATAFARTLATRMTTEKDPATLHNLAVALVEFLRRLEATEAGALASPLVQSLSKRLASDMDPGNLNYLAPATANLTTRLGPKEVVSVAQTLVTRMIAEKDVGATYPLGNALLSLAPSIASADAAALARPLVDRMAIEKDLSHLSYLANAISGLALRLRSEDAGSVARILANRCMIEKDLNVASQVSNAISTMAVQLSPEEAGTIARMLRARVSKDKDNVAFPAVCNTWAALTTRVGPNDAVLMARTLATRLAVEKDQLVMNSLSLTTVAVVPRLTPEEAGTLTRTVVARMIAEKDPSNVIYLSNVLTALVGRLTDNDLLALLKPNVLFPPIRTATLTEFGRRSGRNHTTAAAAVAGWGAVQGIPSPAFPDVWEFIDWAEKARPDLDLSPIPPGNTLERK